MSKALITVTFAVCHVQLLSTSKALITVTFAVCHVQLLSMSKALITVTFAVCHVQLLRMNKIVITYYLSEFVFPRHMRHQRTKLSACAQELGSDVLFQRRWALRYLTPQKLRASGSSLCARSETFFSRHSVCCNASYMLYKLYAYFRLWAPSPCTPSMCTRFSIRMKCHGWKLAIM